MPSKRHKPEEIVAKLRQVDVPVSQGQSVAALWSKRTCRHLTAKPLIGLSLSGRPATTGLGGAEPGNGPSLP